MSTIREIVKVIAFTRLLLAAALLDLSLWLREMAQ